MLYNHLYLLSLVTEEQTVNVWKHSNINALPEINNTVSTKPQLGTATILMFKR